MTVNETDQGGEQIMAAIRAEADTRANEIIQAAKAAAKTQIDKAQRQVEGVRSEALAQAETRGAKLHEREIASGKIEAKRVMLRAREELTAHVLDELEGQLSAIRKDAGQYRQSLWNLSVEAVRAIGESGVVLRASKADAEFFDEAFAERLTAEVSKEPGRSIAVELRLEDRDFGGGCTAQSPDGRIVFDNTYPKRLERERKALREKIVEELVQSND